ncbi:hypothetical protein YC2023_086219 [Brassica napus]
MVHTLSLQVIEGLVVYRQAIHTPFICPISSFCAWKKAIKPSCGVKRLLVGGFHSCYWCHYESESVSCRDSFFLFHPWLVNVPATISNL